MYFTTSIFRHLSAAACVTCAALTFSFAPHLQAAAIHDAARTGDLTKLQSLLSADPKAVAETDSQGRTALWPAVQRDRIEAVRFLLDNGADANVRNNTGVPVLMAAAAAGRTEIVGLLLAKNAAIMARNGEADTALHFAAFNNRPEVATLLLERGAAIDAVNSAGQTPLIYSSWLAKPDMLQLLLQRGANLNIVSAMNGTPLHIVAESGRNEAIALLLQNRANPDSLNVSGETPLHLAARNGNHETVRLLLASAKQANLAESHYGHTPLHWAAIYGHTKIVAALLASGADSTVKDATGLTALDHAARYGHAEVIAALDGKSRSPKPSSTAVAALKGQLPDGQASVWYCGQSGWAVKTANRLLVFDYSRGGQKTLSAPGLQNGFINPAELQGLDVTVFVSHEHADHFDPAIFGWKDSGLKINYVYGFKPTETDKQKYTGPAYTFVGPQETKESGGIKVTGIQSLDTGGGFLLEVDGLVIFHAGDHANLNAGTREAYDKEINSLAPLCDHVDIAFLPVTGCPIRWQRDQVIDGFFSAVSTLKIKTVFPMHGSQSEWKYRDFATLGKTRTPATKILCAQFPGDLYQCVP